MTTPRARAAIRIAAVASAAALLLAACSSDPATDGSTSASASGSTSSVPGDPTTGTGDGEQKGAAALACAAYFELDLLNSTYVGGAVADGDMTEAQVRADFRRLLRIMVAQGTVAQDEGGVDAKLVANSTRMKQAVRELARDAALSDLSKRQQAKFALQSSRVEKSCARAGFPLPADNVTARTAASI